MEKRKKVYLELLRIICILFVLFNHTNGYGFFYFANSQNSLSYGVSLFLSVLCKAAVPLFFMISGSLLLDKEESLRDLFVKRILKYTLLLLLFCSLIHFAGTVRNHSSASIVSHIREILKMVYRGDIGTYWFLYAYLGLLFMLPFLRGMKIILTRQNILYLIILRTILIGITPCAIFLTLGYQMNTAFSSVILTDSVFYFIIGYYFGNREPSCCSNCRFLMLLCWAGLLGIGISCFMTVYEHKATGIYTENFLGNFLPIVCIFLFCLCRNLEQTAKISDLSAKVIVFLGDKTFGIYLLEPLIRICCEDVQVFLFAKLLPLPASAVWCMTEFIIGALIVTVGKSLLRLVSKRCRYPHNL